MEFNIGTTLHWKTFVIGVFTMTVIVVIIEAIK